MPDENPWKKRGKSLRQQSLALTIPSLWLGGPLGGGFVGWLIGNKIGYPDSGAIIGVLLGIVIAIRETVRVLRVLSRDS